MTNQPEPDGQTSPSRDALRDTRWLACGIWAAVFVGLLVTSYAGIVGPMSNVDLSLLSLESFQGDFDGDQNTPNRDLIAVVALAVSAVIALVVLFLWALFGRATTALLSSLTDSADSAREVPATVVWLTASGERSALGDILMWSGLAWALLIARPVLVAALRVLTA